MKKTRTERAESRLVPATAASNGLGYLRVGSTQSRAAARALLAARERKAEDDWDKPLDATELAERIRIAREPVERGKVFDWAPIFIPTGKENTVRGRMAARINAARERMRQSSTLGFVSSERKQDSRQ
jgi:hypothetical protein